MEFYYLNLYNYQEIFFLKSSLRTTLNIQIPPGQACPISLAKSVIVFGHKVKETLHGSIDFPPKSTDRSGGIFCLLDLVIPVGNFVFPGLIWRAALK